MKLYLAGGLFTTAETEFNARLAMRMRSDRYEVFLPQDYEGNHAGAKFDPGAIFDHDVSGIDWCDVVVANMDGADQDSGTCWEVGYGYAKGKGVLLYRTDIRTSREAINLMMEQCANATLLIKLPSVIQLSEELDRALRSPVFESFNKSPVKAATVTERYRHIDK